MEKQPEVLPMSMHFRDEVVAVLQTGLQPSVQKPVMQCGIVTWSLACVYAVERRVCGSVAEAYAAVCRATAAGQQAVLMRRPGDGLHSRRVVTKAQDGRVRVLVPDEQLVVIPTACYLPIVW